MNITITCALEDEMSYGHDCLLPYLAKADFLDVMARGVTPNEAVAHVQGICLHAIADFAVPPELICFTVSFIELTPPSKDPRPS
jgi:hypothetical protein